MFTEKENRIVMVRHYLINMCILKCSHFSVGETPAKRGRPKKSAVSLSERYPVLTTGDINDEEKRSAYSMLYDEMKASKPRRDTFLPFMKSTFAMRRHYIQHSAVSVQHIIRDYAALKEPIAVCY